MRFVFAGMGLGDGKKTVPQPGPVAASSRMLRRRFSVNRDLEKAPVCSSSSMSESDARQNMRWRRRMSRRRQDARTASERQQSQQQHRNQQQPKPPPHLHPAAKELREKLIRNQAMHPNAPVPFYTGTFSFLGSAFVAGAMAGSMADLIMHPVDTINTRLKVSRGPPVRGGTIGYTVKTVYNEGFFSLYRGIGATMAQALPMNAFWFLTYEGFKRQGTKYFDAEYAPAVHFCSAGLGELVSSVFYVPFDVVKTRMQLGANPQLSSAGNVTSSTNYTGTFSALGAIWRSEGIAGLYSGYRACIVSDCSVSALQFMFYERLKSVLTAMREERKRCDSEMLGSAQHQDGQQHNLVSIRDGVIQGRLRIEENCSSNSFDASSTSEPDSRDVFLAGAMAGSTAAFLTNPIDTMTARLMTQGHAIATDCEHRQLRYGSGDLISCARTILREEGPHAFMRGWFPRSARFGALGAIQLALYEKLKLVFGFDDDGED